jgi:hypothetical protein
LSDIKKRVGRPKKADLAAKKPGGRKSVGRPKGDAAIMNEYKARMLNSPKSKKVLTKIFDAALDDDHKGQAAAWKLLFDRLAPLSLFDTTDSKKPSGININISVAGNDKVDVSEDIADADYEEVDDEAS